MVPSSLLQFAEMLKWVSLGVLILNVVVILAKYAHI